MFKGPQGTLFGRNASGGVIQVTTRRPSESFTANAEFGYANYDEYSGKAYVSGPLSGTLRASLAAFGKDQTRGYGKNLTTGEEVYKEASYGGQARLEWAPTSETTFDLNALYTHTRTNAGVARGIFPGALGSDGVSKYVGEYNTIEATDGPARIQQTMVALTAKHDMGGAQFQSILAYHYYDEKYDFTQNGMPFGKAAIIPAFDINPSRTYTAEVQLQAPTDSAFQWVVGAFYMHDVAELNFAIKRDALVLARQFTHQLSTSYAGFAQATVPLGDATRITAGARYTSDHKTISGKAFTGAGVQIGTAASIAAANGFSPKSVWNKLTYRVSVDHNINDNSMVFASYNRGFKSGIYNPTSFTNPPAAPEVVDAFEIGSKNMLLDRRLRLNASVFLYKYSDLQLRTLVPPSPNFVTFNAAKSTVKGVDIDMTLKVSSDFTLTAAGEYLDGVYDSFPRGIRSVPLPTGGNVSQPNADLSGYRMARAPRWTSNVSADYVVSLGTAGQFNFNAAWAYNSGFRWETDGRLRQKPYHSVSASIGWSPANAPWRMTVWGTNLLNEKIHGNATEGPVDTFQAGNPRRYGFTIGVHM